jgi:hypothetical protein
MYVAAFSGLDEANDWSGQPNPATLKVVETRLLDLTSRDKATPEAAHSHIVPGHVTKKADHSERGPIPESPVQEVVRESTLWHAPQTPVTVPAPSKLTLGTSNKQVLIQVSVLHPTLC